MDLQQIKNRWSSKTLPTWGGIHDIPPHFLENLNSTLFLMEEVDPTFRILSIEEKFGRLRVHVLGDDDVQFLARQLEDLCYER